MSRLDLASTLNYGDESPLRTFFNQHNILHQQYASLIVSGSKAVPLFDVSDQGALDDWVALMDTVKEKQETEQSDRINNWLNMHMQLHAGEMSALGLGEPVDIATVDFRQPQQFYDWHLMHTQMHDAQDAALGL
jgi:hypothetical protein